MSAEKPLDEAASEVLPLSQALLLPRIAIEDVAPVVDGGHFAVKALVGQLVTVSAKVFCDGHDQLAVVIRWRALPGTGWQSVAMDELGNDGWQGRFTVDHVGRYGFYIEAWVDTFASFCHDLEKKHAAGQVLNLELQEGRALVEQAIARTQNGEGQHLTALYDVLSHLPPHEQFEVFMQPETAALMKRADHHAYLSHSSEYALEVERERAQFASWYELFPRSITDDPARHGTFDDVHERLPMIR